MSVEDEIALLQRESEIPIEELLNHYSLPKSETDTTSLSTRTSKRKRDDCLQGHAKRTCTEKSQGFVDVGLTAISTLEASAERAKRTTASRPFLLSPWVQLREYQSVGLNWLVSLQTRRLNGILADGKFKYDQGVAVTQYSHSESLHDFARNGSWKNTANNYSSCLFGSLQGNMGTALSNCANQCDRELGDGSQTFLSGF
jgi:hypothetical protein